MTLDIKGFYAAYLSTKTGQGLALLMLRNGVVVGADAGGASIDGRYTGEANGLYKLVLEIRIPANTPMLQGGVASPEGNVSQLSIELPSDFLSREFIRIEGRDGPINAKLVRLRGIDE